MGPERTTKWTRDLSATEHTKLLLDGGIPPEWSSSLSATHEIYGFSCSTFADYCYSKIIRQLVNISAMPLVTDVKRLELEGSRETSGSIGSLQTFLSKLPNVATRDDSYPFSPDNWEEHKSRGVFIPSEDAARHSAGILDGIRGRPHHVVYFFWPNRR